MYLEIWLKRRGGREQFIAEYRVEEGDEIATRVVSRR